MWSINYLGWKSNLSIRAPIVFLYIVYTVSMITNLWERLSWTTTYAKILANDRNRVSFHLVGRGRARLGPLRRRYLDRLIFIVELQLVSPAVHMDPHITDWLTKLTDRFIIYLMLIHAWTWEKTCWWKWVEFCLLIFPAM